MDLKNFDALKGVRLVCASEVPAEHRLTSADLEKLSRASIVRVPRRRVRRNPRIARFARRDVFELLLTIQSEASSVSSDIEGHLKFLRFMDATIDRFIETDNPFADAKPAGKVAA